MGEVIAAIARITREGLANDRESIIAYSVLDVETWGDDAALVDPAQ